MIHSSTSDTYVIFNNYGDLTMTELLNKLYSITSADIAKVGFDVNEILKVTGNSESIYSQYTSTEKKKYGKASVSLIKFGTKVRMPKDKLLKLKPIFQDRSEVFPFQDLNAFWADEIAAIINDEKYKPYLQTNDFGGELHSYLKQMTNVGVYVFSRSLNKLINISAFVISQQVTNANNGGTFNFQLPPLSAEFKDGIEEAWDMVKTNLIEFEVDGIKSFYYKDFYNYIGRNEEGKNTMMIRNIFFDVAIQSQDLVFIKFEKLNSERQQEQSIIDGNISDLNANYFDIIGLVDCIKTGTQPESANVTVSVSGRCLSKMLLDDGIYYFAGSKEVNGFSSQYFANREKIKDAKVFNRVNRIGGEIQDVRLFKNMTLRNYIKYIYNSLTGIQVFDDSKFAGLKTLNKEGDASGVWKLTKLFIDPKVESRQLIDSSLATARNVSLMQVINNACQFPFVEFIMDTYGTNFYWIVRQPPFTKDAFLNNFTINIKSEDILDYDYQTEDTSGYGWYRIEPTGLFAGDADFSNFYFPAIFFPKFAEIYGTKPLDIQCKYLDYGVDKTSVLTGYQQAYNDLRFIVESNAYLPFSRKAKLVLNGDRRIKRGMNVYIEATGELYYVDGVSNDSNVMQSQVERMTVLDLSRGIVRKHADKYFGLVDYTDFNFSKVSNERVINWDVNEKNFEFLLKQKQWNNV